MKIGIVSPYYIDRFGGVQAHILATRSELIRRGHEVKIIAPSARKAGQSKEFSNFITVGASAEIKSKFINTTFPVAMSVKPGEIKNLLEEENFDVLHVHEPYFLMLPYQFVSEATCPVVGTMHANWAESIKNKTLSRTLRRHFKKAATKVDVLTAVSPAAGAFARKGVDKDFTIVPNGIELAAFNPKDFKISPHKNKTKKTILYVGRLEKRKGVMCLVKAYQKLIETTDDLELIIAGSGPTGRTLKDYVKRHKLSNVKFLGHVTEQDKKELLRSADVYCSPALFGESFGIVLLEAMAMGAVVVAGNNPGYSYVMQDRGSFSIIDPESTEEFATKLKVMLEDKEVRKLWLEWADEYVKQFDYKVVTDQYERIYKGLVNA